MDLQNPPVAAPESALIPGMMAPIAATPGLDPGADLASFTGGFPNIPDSSIPGPLAASQISESWTYDFDPATGVARATFPGEIGYAGSPAAGVLNFNGRAGNVTLTTADITGAGGATQAYVNSTFLPLTGGTLAGPGHLTIQPTAGSLAIGLTISQSLAGSGPEPPGDALNLINIISDQAVHPTPATGFYNGFEVSHNIGGATASGGRQATASFITLTAPTNPAAGNSARSYIGGAFASIALTGDNGTNTGAGALGDITGLNAYAWAKAGATNLAEVSGAVINVAVESGATVRNKYLLHLSSIEQDVVSGTNTDSMVGLSAALGSSGHFFSAITIGDMDGRMPLAAGSQIMDINKNFLGANLAVQNGINFSNATFSGSAFLSPGFSVSGTGNLIATTLNVAFGGGVTLPSGYAAQVHAGSEANATFGAGAFFGQPNGVAIVSFDDAGASILPLVLEGSTIALNGAVTLNQTSLFATTVNLTDVSGSAAGTLTNAPSAGNPTKWVAFSDNGTVRRIPCW